MTEGHDAVVTSLPRTGPGPVLTVPVPAETAPGETVPGETVPALAAAAAGAPAAGTAGTGAPAAPPPAARRDDAPAARVDAARLEAALLAVRRPVAAAPLALAAPGVEQARAERAKLLSQIDDYLLPRLRNSGAPILIALVGSTGAGKSTLMNSIAGRPVSATGIRRPTTNSPVLACHPGDARWFAENVFLPTLPRVRQEGLAMPGRDGLLVLAETEGMPPGVAVLDTPDIDSVVRAHHEFARQFLDASDLWLFVTTARRYADAAVWEMLKDGRDRGAAMAVALSRVPADAAPQLSAHFAAMLDANGLAGVRRFVIPETVVTDARLPPEAAAPVADWLADTARRDERRVAVLTQTMAGVLDTFRDRVPVMSDHLAEQRAVRRNLRAAVQAAYGAALEGFMQATAGGSLLRGEVVARWQDFAGTGELLRALQVRRGRGGRLRRQRPSPRAEALRAALEAAVTSLTVATAARAAEQAAASWQLQPAGQSLLAGAGAPPLARPGPDVAGRAAQAASGWQDHVLDLVRDDSAAKRSVARMVSLEEESLALVLSLAALAPEQAGGPDAGAVSQRFLESVFGAGPLRELRSQARADLRERAGRLLEAETGRYFDAADAGGVPGDEAAVELLQAGNALEGAR